VPFLETPHPNRTLSSVISQLCHASSNSILLPEITPILWYEKKIVKLQFLMIYIDLAKEVLVTDSTLMPIPSASLKNIFTVFKLFWARSMFFQYSQIVWSWSKARFYLINLHIWAWSNLFEHFQKILNMVKNIWTWSKNIWTSRWIRHKSSYDIASKVHLCNYCFCFMWNSISLPN